MKLYIIVALFAWCQIIIGMQNQEWQKFDKLHLLEKISRIRSKQDSFDLVNKWTKIVKILDDNSSFINSHQELAYSIAQIIKHRAQRIQKKHKMSDNSIIALIKNMETWAYKIQTCSLQEHNFSHLLPTLGVPRSVHSEMWVRVDDMNSHY